MTNIFFSYSHADASTVRRIQDALEGDGHRVWRDLNQGELALGEPIPSFVWKGLEESDYLLVAISKSSLASRWMRHEVNTFLMDRAKENKVIPLLLDETAPTEFHGLLQPVVYVDFRDVQEGISDLLRFFASAPSSRQSEEDTDVDGRLDFALDVALRSGSVAMRYYNSSLSSNRNLDERRNAATAADRAAQREFEKARLAHPTFCKDAFIGEEQPHNRTPPSKEGYTWVVDPLDGTTNFVNGIPLFCSAVGVLYRGEPFIGVVYSPATNEVYFAVQGSQARIWDVDKGKVSLLESDQSARALSSSLLGTHISSREVHAEKLLNGRIQDAAAGFANIRTLGSGLLALAYVSAGRLQAFVQYGSHLWDQVAGIVLVNSAGGSAFRLPSGRPWSITARDYAVACNPAIRDRVVELFSRKAG